MTLPSDSSENATAQTLNYALGNLGGRRKSWMQQASQPPPSPGSAMAPGLAPARPTQALRFTVKRRGRPPKPPAQAASSSTTPTNTTMQRQPPSNSTSPQLANVVTGARPRATPPLPVLPSPTPSEESMYNAPQRRTPSTQSAVTSGDHAFPPGPFNYPPHTPLETVFMDAMRNAAPQKRPAESPAAITPAKNPRVEAPQARATTTTLAAIPAQNFSAPQPSHDSASNQLSADRAPVLNPAWYTQQHCMVKLSDFYRSGLIPPQFGPDHTRIDVLRGAAEGQDWHYLIMHQIYCLADFNRELIPPEIRQQPGFDEALSAIARVLSSNSELSPPVLQFFSQFPDHLPEIYRRYAANFKLYKRGFQLVVDGMKDLEALRMIYIRRGFPPLTAELVCSIGVVSPVFQDMVYVSIVRSIWQGPTGAITIHFEEQARALLHEERSTHNRQSSEEQSLLASQHMLDWKIQYGNLSEAYRSALINQSRSGFVQPQQQQQHQKQHQQQHQQQQQQQYFKALASSRFTMLSNAQSGFHRHLMPSNSAPRPTVHPPRPVQAPQQALLRRLQAPQQTPPRSAVAQSRARLLPNTGPPPPMQRVPAPARFGLHQAGARSPVLKSLNMQTSLCHYVRCFLIRPRRLSSAGHELESWLLDIDADMAQDMARFKKEAPGAADTLIVGAGNKTVRLRCVKVPKGQEVPDEHAWVTKDVSWIPYSYFTLNGRSLEQRKKLHHGKDLPIDLTCHLKEGRNVLEISVMGNHGDTAYQNYMVAVEVLEVMPQGAVVTNCVGHQRLSYDDVLSQIQRKLSGGTDDSDDLVIVESNLSINLFDPFIASRFCEIPARSKLCRHNDCFDLQTFLTTRKQSGDATVPDQWRCPICSADARPQHLLVDDFIQKVQEKLTIDGLANTRAIVVSQDGSWKPKEEMRDPNGVSDRSPSPRPSRATPSVSVEIISLID